MTVKIIFQLSNLVNVRSNYCTTKNQITIYLQCKYTENSYLYDNHGKLTIKNVKCIKNIMDTLITAFRMEYGQNTDLH